MIPRSRQFQNEVNCSFCNLKNINTEYYPNLKLEKKKASKNNPKYLRFSFSTRNLGFRRSYF